MDSVHQVENLLFNGDLFHESESHPLIKLCFQLQQIDDEYDFKNVNKLRQFTPILDSFEVNSFCHLIKQYSSRIPLSILPTIFDVVRLKVFINMISYPSLSDYYFDLSFAYLITDSTINYLISANHTQPNIDEYLLNLFSSICSRSVYVKKCISYSLYVAHNHIPTFFQWNESTERLLKAFITYLNGHFFKNYPLCQSYISIMKWTINMADIYGFVPYFVNTDYPNAISQWMSIESNQFYDIPLESWSLVVALLHNLTRNIMGVKALNELKMIDILKKWKEKYGFRFLVDDDNDCNKEILMTYYLIYAALLEPNELKKESISSVQNILDYILERTIKALNSPDLTSDSYNVCEYLDGLAKFVVNDTFLIYIISYGNVYELFVDKFLIFNTMCESTALHAIICASLYTIFWSISFLPEYSAKLKLNDKFLSFVEQKARSLSNDEHTLTMKRAAKGILFNLDSIQTETQLADDQAKDDDDNDQIKIMISYSHQDMQFCKKLVQNIQERFQGDVWVDFDKLSPPYEDDWEEIAKAITCCHAVLMIVTENYCSSKSCRREVIHADKRNKRMIPIYQGKDYKPDDWFEIRAGSATWVRFGDKKTDEEVMETLLTLINVREKIKPIDKHLSLICQSGPTDTSKTPTTNVINVQTTETVTIEIIETQSQTVLNVIPTSTVEQWTSEEVQQWFHLPPATLQLSSGRALLTYMNLLSHEDAQYDEYENRMRHHGISRERFSNLISSFASIRALNNTQTTSSKQADQWTREEIKYWFRQNHLSDHLFNILDFVDGSQLITYGRLIINSRLRMDEEYDRLRNLIGKDCFYLNEYARFIDGLQKLIQRSEHIEESASCSIL